MTGTTADIIAFSDLVFPQEAAKIIGKSLSTLAHWRMYGKGPRWTKLGREAVYSKADLAAYKAQSITVSPLTAAQKSTQNRHPLPAENPGWRPSCVA